MSLVSLCVESSHLQEKNTNPAVILSWSALPVVNYTAGQWVQAQHHWIHYSNCKWRELKSCAFHSQVFWSLQITLKTHYAGLLTWTSTSWGDQLMVWLLSLSTCKWEWCSQIGLKETATFLWNLFMKLYISCANWPCLAVWYLVHSLVQSYK